MATEEQMTIDLKRPLHQHGMKVHLQEPSDLPGEAMSLLNLTIFKFQIIHYMLVIITSHINFK